MTRVLLVASVPIAITQLGAWLTSQGDLWIASLELGDVDAGRYAAAMRLVTIVLVPLQAAQLANVTMIARLHALGERGLLEQRVRRAALATAVPTLVLLACLIVFAEPLLRIAFGPRYVSGSDVLRLLALGQLANALTGLCGIVLTMTGFQWHAMVLAVGGGTVSVVADIVGARVGGMNGLAAASAATTAATFAAVWLACWALTGIWTHPSLGAWRAAKVHRS